jgi:lysozyme
MTDGGTQLQYVEGIDVSDFQDVNSFHAVANSGRQFVICKATEGRSVVENKFADYRDRCRSIGLLFGAYHFLTWTTPPAQQAANFLGRYQPTNGDLLPMLDLEACAVDSGAAINQVASFLHFVEPHLGGARMLLYMSFSFATDHLRGGSAFSGHPLYVAAYNNAAFAANVPQAWRNGTPGCRFWQYSDDVDVPGITRGVDGDRFVGTLDELQDGFTLQGLPD